MHESWDIKIKKYGGSDINTSHNLSIQLGSSTITPSRKARNLGVVIDDQLNFTDQVASTARSCRF
ncbi:MAG: hypothetical protein ACRC8Q_13265, partial [Aeromonas sp.]